MRKTLEQLKAMSDRELTEFWVAANWPFDRVVSCDHCLTQHGWLQVRCHPALTVAIHRMAPTSDNWLGPKRLMNMRLHMEELYALRLFFDSLYPPSTEEVSVQTEQLAALELAQQATAEGQQ